MSDRVRPTPRRAALPAWVKRAAPLTLVIAVHGAVIMGLLSLAPVRQALGISPVLTIDLLHPPPSPPPPPVVHKAPPKPKEVTLAKPVPPPVLPLPLLTAPADTPSPVVVAQQPEPPRIPPPVEAAPAPAAPAAPAPAPNPPAAPRVVTGVEYLRAPQPQYPALSRRRSEQGRVVLRVLVNTQGHPERADIQQSSGSAALDDAARRAALQALFKPHLENGQPVPVWAIVPIIFSLEG